MSVSSVRVVMVLLLVALGPAISQAATKPCHSKAIRLLKDLSPDGFKIFEIYPDKADFKRWIECDDLQGGLATAVHETIHAMTANRNAYPLINGGTAWRLPESPEYYPPRLLLHRFPAQSQYVISYLKPGAASSADFFRYLLDEFNAYTHDLNTVIGLDSIRVRAFDSGHRDGLASMMAFVATYVEVARQEHPRTWAALQRPRVRQTVATLWEQAEDIMGRSCHLARYSFETPDYLRSVCGKTDKHGLGRLLGRPPLCPIRCKLQVASNRYGREQVIISEPGRTRPQPVAVPPAATLTVPPVRRGARPPRPAFVTPPQPAHGGRRSGLRPLPKTRKRRSWVQQVIERLPDGGS